MMRKLVFGVGLALLVGLPVRTSAKELDPALKTEVGKAIDKAVQYLRTQQLEDGSFAQGDFGPAITSLLVTGLLDTGRVTLSDPLVGKGLAYLEKHIQPDGGIYVPGSKRNYPTAIAVLAFVAANKDGRYAKTIDNAVAYLKSEQWDAGEDILPDNPKFGGAGYGGDAKTRPDLSNTAFMLEALQAAGLPKDDPAFQRAIVFVSRCQNLTGEGANDLPIAEKGPNDGGFFYTPVENYNPGGFTDEGGLRSYASMTYAGLKSFLYAGVDKDDPRVKAATEWIQKHYSLDENPGMGQQGLYYYYHTFAKALNALGVDKFTDAEGKEHDWQADLVRAILARQKKDGSWSNETPRWLENDPHLVTGYVLMALGQAMKAK